MAGIRYDSFCGNILQNCDNLCQNWEMLERRRLKGYIGDVINDKDNDGNDMLTRNLNGTAVSLAYISDFGGIGSRL